MNDEGCQQKTYKYTFCSFWSEILVNIKYFLDLPQNSSISLPEILKETIIEKKL